MTRNLSTILACARRRRLRRRTCRCGQALHDPRRRVRPRRGHEPVRRDGLRVHGWDYKRILAHYYTGTALGVLNDAARGARAAAVHERRGVVLGRHARGRAHALGGQDVHRPRPRGRAGAAARPGAGACSRPSPAPLRATGPAPLTLKGRAGNGRTNGTYRGALEFRAGTFGGINAINAVGVDDYVQGVVPLESPSVVADRGAQGAGRRGAHLRAHDEQGRRRLRPLPGHALAGLRRRRRRGGVHERGDAGDGRASSSPTKARPVATYFFSTSGGRTEDVENTSLGDTPQPWLKSVEDEFDGVSPRHRWGPIRMTLRERRRQARLARPRALQGHPGDHARPLAADRRRRRRRHGRAHARRRRDAARALRPLRHVGVLHVDHDAQGAQAAAATRHGGPEAPVVARAPKIASLAGSVIPARRGARSRPAARRRQLDPGGRDAAPRARPLPLRHHRAGPLPRAPRGDAGPRAVRSLRARVQIARPRRLDRQLAVDVPASSTSYGRGRPGRPDRCARADLCSALASAPGQPRPVVAGSRGASHCRTEANASYRRLARSSTSDRPIHA